VLEGGSGVGLIDSLVKTGKWSDGDQWVKETPGASKVSEEVMTRFWLLSVVSLMTLPASSVYVTVRCLSVPSVDSSPDVQLVCYMQLGRGRQISVESIDLC